MEVRRGLTARRRAIPALLAGLVALGAIASFWLVRAAVARPQREQAQVVAAAAASAVRAQLQTDAALLGAASQALGGEPTGLADLSQLTPIDPTASLGVARTTPSGRTVLETVLSTDNGAAAGLRTADLAARPEWRLALELARDGGATVAAAAVNPPAGATVLEAKALYGTAGVPTQVSDRRQSLAGYVVLVEPASSLVGLSAGDIGSQFAVDVVQGETVLTSYGAPRSIRDGRAKSSAAVTLNGVNWAVQVWPVQSRSTLPWAVLAGGLLVAAVVGAAATLMRRRSDELADAAIARASELDLIARTGEVLQQSLDLAELLPTFVVEVSDELGLVGVAIALMSDSGGLVRIFSLGTTRPHAGLDPFSLSDGAMSVSPGATITVPLQRAGRVVGVLSAEAPKGLAPSQISVLRAACDLLAAALGNARLFQAEQDMVTSLRELDRLKTTFVGSVSHELRTSVTAIEGFGELLAGPAGELDEEQRTDYVARLRRNARSLRVLVEDLLDFARLERVGLSVVVQPVDLSDHVPKVIEQMSSILGERPLDVVVAPGLVAVSDPVAVERILVNLLSNAAKYTPPDTPIQVRLDREGGNAVLSVSDRGPGIPPEDRERVFDMFYRLDNEAARATRGVGMGLALVRQLVELLHGTVAVDESPGGGARFRVTVPLFVTNPTPPGSRVAQDATAT